MKIAAQTALSSLFGLAFFGLALFVPAGTFDYWQAWVFIAVFMVVTLVTSVYLAIEYPETLRRRIHAGPIAETRPVQRLVSVGSIVAVLLMLVISALDHRFGWSSVPTPVVLAGNVLVAAGLLLAQLAVMQNAYAASTITVENGQRVVSTGLYGWVRHPLYFGALVMMFGTPPALDSYWGLAVVFLALLVLAVRIFDEEKMLTQELDGYRDYMAHVRYRLMPHVW